MRFSNWSNDHNTAIRDSIADVFHKSETTFAELKGVEGERTAAAICFYYTSWI